jgi:hypothetical protein
MESKGTKRCSDCKKVLSEDDFYWQKDNRQESGGYLKSECKRCCRNRNYLFRLTNPEYSKQYHKDNKEYEKQYKKDNAERINLQRRQYRKDNIENIKQQNKKYKQNNRDKINALVMKRKAMKFNQTPQLTEIEQNRISFIYRVCSTMANYHVDHIQPLSKGGLHHPNNLQILHKNLNLEKSDKYPLTEEEEIKYKGYKL